MKLSKKIITAILLISILFLYFWTKPLDKTSSTIKVYDKNNLLLYQTGETIGNQENIVYKEIPNSLIEILILTEDKRFWNHHGIDIIGSLRAVFQNITNNEIVSGASTITQQLARFTTISPLTPAKQTLFRKIREVLIALRIEMTKSKKEVLLNYLNIIYFGRNAYGLKAASNLYFDKNPHSLSISEQALLVGIIQNPSFYDPINNSQNCLKRRNIILKNALDNKIINQEEFDNSINNPLPNEIFANYFNSPHIVQMALIEIENKNINSKKGLKIYLTVDNNWNEIVSKIAILKVNSLRKNHNLNNAAVVIIDNKSREILSLIGSIDYSNSSIEGQNNMALALRQPGSALKPLTYAIAFQNNIATPGTLIDDSPKIFLTKDNKSYSPQNYDQRFRGPVLIREALASSYNLAAVEILDQIGIKTFIDYGQKFGIKSLTKNSNYDLSITLGGGEITLLELTNFYASLANKGEFQEITFIEKITDNNNQVIFSKGKLDKSKVIDSEVAYLITDILSDNKARIPNFGEKNTLVTSKKSAVKTGTTTDWHDNWTIGYTKDFTVGVWVGNSNNDPMIDITGVTGAAPIWHDIMEELLINFPYTEFEIPDNLSQVEICAWDGKLPNSSCNQKYLELFIKGTEPRQTSTLTDKNNFSSDLNNKIISPKQNSVFTINDQKEKITFELNNPNIAREVKWILNDQNISLYCSKNSPYYCFWNPQIGKFNLKAFDSNANLIDEVNFTVINQH